jgi:dual specificity phosphatase 12
MVLRRSVLRTELANREHMLDHGQLGPPTPAVALSPATSRRPSTNDVAPRRPSSSSSRRPSAGVLGITRPRLGSSSGPTRPSPLTPVDGLSGLAASLSMSALDDDESKSANQESDPPAGQPVQPQRRRSGSFGTDLRSRLLSGLSGGISTNLSMSALDSDDDESVGSTTSPSATVSTPRMGGIPTAETVPSTAPTSGASETVSANSDSTPTSGKSRPPPPPPLSIASAGGGSLQHGADLAAQLHANPKLSALRPPGGFTMTPLHTAPRVVDKSSISPPILMNSKCSGYFVEPVSLTCLGIKSRVLISLDEMDGVFLTGWATRREDNMSKQEMWHEARKL